MKKGLMERVQVKDINPQRADNVLWPGAKTKKQSEAKEVEEHVGCPSVPRISLKEVQAMLLNILGRLR